MFVSVLLEDMEGGQFSLEWYLLVHLGPEHLQLSLAQLLFPKSAQGQAWLLGLLHPCSCQQAG